MSRKIIFIFWVVSLSAVLFFLIRESHPRLDSPLNTAACPDLTDCNIQKAEEVIKYEQTNNVKCGLYGTACLNNDPCLINYLCSDGEWVYVEIDNAETLDKLNP